MQCLVGDILPPGYEGMCRRQLIIITVYFMTLFWMEFTVLKSHFPSQMNRFSNIEDSFTVLFYTLTCINLIWVVDCSVGVVVEYSSSNRVLNFKGTGKRPRLNFNIYHYLLTFIYLSISVCTLCIYLFHCAHYC